VFRKGHEKLAAIVLRLDLFRGRSIQRRDRALVRCDKEHVEDRDQRLRPWVALGGTAVQLRVDVARMERIGENSVF